MKIPKGWKIKGKETWSDFDEMIFVHVYYDQSHNPPYRVVARKYKENNRNGGSTIIVDTTHNTKAAAVKSAQAFMRSHPEG